MSVSLTAIEARPSAEILHFPKWQHWVQFYDQSKFLAESITRYLWSGLGNGEAAIVVATPAHWELIRKNFEIRGLNLEAVQKQGQLRYFDAEATLESLLVGGVPDEQRFETVIVRQISETAERFHRVRAYGEMVDLLRQRGAFGPMLALEELWNQAGQRLPLQLLCGYEMKGLANAAHTGVFAQICDSHTHVLPVERIASVEECAARNRTIAELQQQADSLRSEIEERKRVERRLREREERLELALEARDEFIAIASHELRTPLTALKLNTQLFEQRLKNGRVSQSGPCSVTRFVALTSRQARRLSKLVEDMLDASTINQGFVCLDAAPMDLAEMVQEQLEQVSEQLEEAGCRLDARLEAGVAGIWDRYRLEQVLLNLLSNAIKYAPGGTITVRVQKTDRHACLSVQDSGIGIERENFERIFERFERAISAYEVSGLGLGLFISKRIVEAHQGSIRVESELGRGSTFSVRLPLG